MAVGKGPRSLQITRRGRGLALLGRLGIRGGGGRGKRSHGRMGRLGKTGARWCCAALASDLKGSGSSVVVHALIDKHAAGGV